MNTKLVSYKKIKSSFGETEIRPVIHLKIKIGSEAWVTEITLAQRSGLTYPMLIGRNTLNKKHIIHSHRSYCWFKFYIVQMKIFILSRNSNLYSTNRMLEAGRRGA